MHQFGFIYTIEFSFKLTILVKIIGTGEVVPVNAIKASGGVKVQLHIFLFPAPTHRETACGTHCRGGWMGPEPVLERTEVFCLCHELNHNSSSSLWPSHYTDWAILAPVKNIQKIFFLTKKFIKNIWSIIGTVVCCSNTGVVSSHPTYAISVIFVFECHPVHIEAL